MSLSVCPVAVCRAPVEAVWALLVDPHCYDAWIDASVESVDPPGPARPGQRITLKAPARGRWSTVRFTLESVNKIGHVLTLSARFPLGITVESRIAVTAIDESSCRVQYG
jgi:uncharacterized protein YndB with AHSA1/START domain